MKFGAPILTSELSGALGGIVGSKSRGGVGYFRTRVRPGNPRTTNQSIVRALLTSLAASWRATLTALQRAAWSAIASPTESGIDAYVRANVNLLQTAEGTLHGPVLAAPASAALSTPYVVVTDPVIDDSANTLVLTVPAATDRKCGYAVYLAPPQSPSRASRQFPFTFLGQVASDEDTPVTIPIPFAFQGATAKVQYVRLVAVGYDSSGGDPVGTVGTPQEFRLTIVA